MDKRNTFTIVITAQQAHVIAEALRTVHGTDAPEYNGSDLDEGRYLRDAFTSLPEDDAALPEGTVHGFSL